MLSLKVEDVDENPGQWRRVRFSTSKQDISAGLLVTLTFVASRKSLFAGSLGIVVVCLHCQF